MMLPMVERSKPDGERASRLDSILSGVTPGQRE
jgi:hypothetical protein